MKRAPWIPLVLPFLVVGCGSTQHAPRSQAVPAKPSAAPSAAAVAAQDPMLSIARLEDLRTDGDGLLQALAARGEERTRVRAVRALGRLDRAEHGASVTETLAAALHDGSTAVRAAAAFALGMRADPATIGELTGTLGDDDEPAEVRARAVEALSRIDDTRARRAVIEAIAASDATVAAQAALGVHRFPREATEGAAAEAALVRLLATDAQGDARAYALFSLARRSASGARAEFERAAASDDARLRIFALQGLGSIPSDARAARILDERLDDADWRVACEAAIALGKHADAASAPALVRASARAVPPHAAHHVRRAAFEALGLVAGAADAARPALERARSDASPSVRAAAIEAGARLYRDDALSGVEAAATDADAVVRAGAAAAAAHLSPAVALPILERLLVDPVLRVATAAADALGEHADDPACRERIRALLVAPDNGLRLSAATALKSKATVADLPALERALATSRGEIAPEVAAAVVDAAQHVGEPALDLLKFALTNPDPYVAKKARAASLAIRPDPRLPRSPPPPKRSDVLPAPHTGPNPRVAFETTRGTLVFELYPDEAPFHVANLLELARRGHYDGTIFHRVVPDFVAQGGDRRGDGNGGTTWRGDALRGEFGPRPFRHGSLGMPRNDDPDSGGSQIFVTHRDTPHLDGRYTLFGDLVKGSEVLDALQVGDRILRVRVVEATEP